MITNAEKMKIEDLGYNSFFEANRNQLGLSAFSIARVTSETKGAYWVKNSRGEYLSKITGKQIFKASSREDYPAVGDWVAITELDEDHATIHGILPRATIIKRKSGDKNRVGRKDKTQIIATNIDVAFVVESINRDFNINRFERYFAIVEDGGVQPIMVLNKIDLIPKAELEEKLSQLKSRFPGVEIILTSVMNNEGLDSFKKYIFKGKTYCFLGSSGVGKSSLINKLLDRTTIKTGEISAYSGRGKHVTTVRQMYFLKDGGMLIDNPGMREVGVTNIDQGIDESFDEIEELSQGCKYTNCTHISEQNCKVLNAIKLGKLDQKKYLNYINLKKEAKYHEMKSIEKRNKDQQSGKFVKSNKRIKKINEKS